MKAACRHTIQPVNPDRPVALPKRTPPAWQEPVHLGHWGHTTVLPSPASPSATPGSVDVSKTTNPAQAKKNYQFWLGFVGLCLLPVTKTSHLTQWEDCKPIQSSTVQTHLKSFSRRTPVSFWLAFLMGIIFSTYACIQPEDSGAQMCSQVWMLTLVLPYLQTPRHPSATPVLPPTEWGDRAGGGVSHEADLGPPVATPGWRCHQHCCGADGATTRPAQKSLQSNTGGLTAWTSEVFLSCATLLLSL